MGIKERPILMHARSINGILEGRKTQTRRIIKIDPSACFVQQGCDCTAEFDLHGKIRHVKNPYGVKGDRLWVRERWAYVETHPGNQVAIYHDGSARYKNGTPVTGEYHTNHLKWKSSIHMPRWASRLTLEIARIRVERVQDISEKDAQAEGAPYICVGCGNDPRKTSQAEGHWQCDQEDDKNAGFRAGFSKLWNDTNGKGAWERNDWCWVIDFRRLQ